MNIIEQLGHKTKKKENLITILIFMEMGEIIMISIIITSLLSKISIQNIKHTMQTMDMTDIYRTNSRM